MDRAGIELATPGSAVRQASVARHVTDCATRPGIILEEAGMYIPWSRDTPILPGHFKKVLVLPSAYFGILLIFGIQPNTRSLNYDLISCVFYRQMLHN